MVASKISRSDRNGREALQVITKQENEEAMKVALEKYCSFSMEWQREAWIKKMTNQIRKRAKRAEKLRKQNESDNMEALTEDDEYLVLISSEDDNPRQFEISRKAVLMSNLAKSILEGGT